MSVPDYLLYKHATKGGCHLRKCLSKLPHNYALAGPFDKIEACLIIIKCSINAAMYAANYAEIYVAIYAANYEAEYVNGILA